MQGDLISVIIPIYNVREYLPQCLESLRNQTLRLFLWMTVLRTEVRKYVMNTLR